MEDQKIVEQTRQAFADALLDTMRITVNYDQVFGGEAAEQPGEEPTLWSRAVLVYGTNPRAS